MSIAKRKLKWYQKLMTEATAVSINSVDDEWWWIVFAVWLTDERCLALFPVATIVRDPHHRESPIRRIWTCAEPEFRFRWMKLCSSDNDNDYTMAPLCKKYIRFKRRVTRRVLLNKGSPLHRFTKIFVHIIITSEHEQLFNTKIFNRKGY